MVKLTLPHIAACALLLNMVAAVSALGQGLSADSFPVLELSLSDSNSPIGRSALLAPRDIGRLVVTDGAMPHEGIADDADAAKVAAQPFSLVSTGEFLAQHRVIGDPILLAQAGGTMGGEEGWPWRKSGTQEYVAVSLSAATAAYFEIRNSREPGKARWKARNGFDESIRDAMRLKSRSARDASQMASDAIMGLMIGAPIIETFATLGLRDSRWDAQWQTQMVNIESFALTSVVSSMMQNLLTRERPFVRNCRNGDCEGDLLNRSMPSGHVAFAFTGAGLLCNHHKYQAIYDDPATGRAICATGIGVSVLDGVLRIVSDRHYATDVAVGTVIGLFSGFALPRLLHYSHPRKPEEDQESEKPGVSLVSVTPEFLSGGAALSCDFRF